MKLHVIHPKKVNKIQPFTSNILWMQDYMKYISQNAGLSSTEPRMLASVCLPFCMWKNTLCLQVKGITNASLITLVSQHHLCSLAHVSVYYENNHHNNSLRWDTGTKPFLNRKVFFLLLLRQHQKLKISSHNLAASSTLVRLAFTQGACKQPLFMF